MIIKCIWGSEACSYTSVAMYLCTNQWTALQLKIEWGSTCDCFYRSLQLPNLSCRPWAITSSPILTTPPRFMRPNLKYFAISKSNLLQWKELSRVTNTSIILVSITQITWPFPCPGCVPAWLSGRLLRNGPGMFEIGDTKYNHWFDGQALLHSFTIVNG